MFLRGHNATLKPRLPGSAPNAPQDRIEYGLGKVMEGSLRIRDLLDSLFHVPGLALPGWVFLAGSEASLNSPKRRVGYTPWLRPSIACLPNFAVPAL